MELERKSGYYHGYIILEDCVENGEILYDRALKKILENKFACGEGDWWEGIDLRDEPEIFVSSEGQSTAEELESLIKFIKLLLEEAKEENSATYNEKYFKRRGSYEKICSSFLRRRQRKFGQAIE